MDKDEKCPSLDYYYQIRDLINQTKKMLKEMPKRTSLSERDLEDIFSLIDCAEDLVEKTEMDSDLYAEFTYVMGRIKSSELYKDKTRREGPFTFSL